MVTLNAVGGVAGVAGDGINRRCSEKNQKGVLVRRTLWRRLEKGGRGVWQ